MKPEKLNNPMRKIKIDKVVVNICVGSSGERLERAAKILEQLTGMKPSYRKAKRTIKDFGIRKGERIAVVATLRGEKARSFLEKAFEAVKKKIKASSFDEYGNFAFGIKEHIEIPETKYDPNLGIVGMDVCVSLSRPGYRVMRRKIARSRIPLRHRVSKQEAIEFVEKEFGVTVVGK